MTKHILITGGTGFIGSRLCPTLLSRGYQLTVLSRQRSAEVYSKCGHVNAISTVSEIADLDPIYGVINLAGAGIAEKRWTENRKQILRDSRIAVTRDLVEALTKREQKPEIFVSGSAVGFYGSHGGEPVTEESPPHDEFTHQLCSDWEREAQTAEQFGARVCLSRTGVVVGPAGGFLQQMLLPFRFGVGGRLGDGQQYMPWVHRHDVVNALIWMLETDSATGAFNVVSPHPVTNQKFTRTLGRVLRRPTVLPVPAFVLQTALGEMSTLLLNGQRALPARLQASGFEFTFPELAPALEDAI